MTDRSSTARDTGLTTAPQLEAFGRRYAAVGQAAVGSAAALVAPFAGPPIGVERCVVITVLLVAWNGIYLLGYARPGFWAMNAGVVVALCVLQPWLVDPGDLVRFTGWVTVVAAFSVVAVQWHLRPAPAMAVTAIVVVAYVIGAAWSSQVTVIQAVAAGGLWMVAEAGLSRLLWVLVRRGGRTADGLLEREFALQREVAVAAARRRQQRIHWATVHDTAASTLLMVGSGDVRGTESWLAPQIDRDLAALSGPAAPPVGDVDLVAALAEIVERARVPATFEHPSTTWVPAPVGVALAAAVGEALENVRRHAGVDRADVHLAADGGSVVVVISDAGRGFSRDDIGADRAGLALSISERVGAVGAVVRIRSIPGCGTTVRMEWRRG